MREHIRAPLPQIEVIAAASNQEPILANLLELYVHDFSEFHDVHEVWRRLPGRWEARVMESN
jgi:hypothetical protein